MKFKFPKIFVVAHRGAAGGVLYENTIGAFQKAIDIGADCIECDIRRTLDEKIIVFHDESIDGRLISALSYREILETARYHVPTLEETLLFVKNRILIDIELKEEGYEEEVIALIKRHLEPKEFFIRSFLDKTLIKIKHIDNTIVTALLLGVGKPKIFLLTRLSELFPFFRILKTKCDYVSPYYKLLKFGFLFRMNILRKPVSVWTVDEQKLMKKYLTKNIASIVTNYPEEVLKILADTKRKP